MMEPQIWDGATNLGLAILRNKLGITEPHQLSIAEAERTAFRLTQLRSAPIRGGFDSIHLQEIHHHIYQDLYDWAGEFRPESAGSQTVEASLNASLDQLQRENHLKGFKPEEWVVRASSYVHELGAIRPFLNGNDVVLREFAEELASKNNLSIQWQTEPENISTDFAKELQRSDQTANMRRMVMLAMDTDYTIKPNRGQVEDLGIDRSLHMLSALL